ncbi:hypothetical protein [Streptomyces sp. NPDC039016]|uniref:hypothetical protein n=1 Tax=Streptomyces sp. NPDC039016 TaxID=3154330 RepID=UPI0033DD669D
MRKDTGIPGARPRIPAPCRLPLTALAIILTILLGAAAPAYALKSARPAASASKSSGAAAAANSLSEEEKHSKRETERSRPGRLTPAAEGVPPTRRPLPPHLSGAAGDDEPTGPVPAADGGPQAPRPAQLPVLHCVFRC